MTAAHFVDASIALIFGAYAAIILLITHAMADDRRHIRHGRLPLQPLEPIDLGQEPPEPGSEREANLLLARWAQEGGDDA